MSIDIIGILKSVDPFRSLPAKILEDIALSVTVKKYPAGHYVIKKGDKSLQTLFVVIDGIGEILVSGDGGQEIVVSQRSKFDFFGETVLFDPQKTYPGSVRAKSELSCLLIKQGEIKKLLTLSPHMANQFTEVLLKRMRSLYDEMIADQSFEAYSNVELPLFRKRVKEVMTSPVFTCHITDSVIDVANIMTQKKISALIVMDSFNSPVGLITERDMVAKLIAPGKLAALTVKEIMGSDLIKIEANSSINQALLAVAKHRVKHLAVIENDVLVGIVTVGDLAKTRSTGSLMIMNKIENQDNLEGLTRAGNEVDNLLNALIAEKASVPETFEIVSEFHDRLVRRVIKICEGQMLEEGFGLPPVSYCWLNMGSAGRREQTLRTDQDNAILYDDSNANNKEQVKSYFLELASRIVSALIRCGFEKCPGNIMASNPQWCHSYNQWLKLMGEWAKLAHVKPDYVRNMTIFLDFRPVYGNMALAEDLRQRVFKELGKYDSVFHFLTRDDNKFRVPLTIWGGIITEKAEPHKGQINLKGSACIHIVNCLRVFALRNMVCETSTLGRLARLSEIGILEMDDADLIQAAFETLMMLRIRQNLKNTKRGLPADNFITLSQLTRREKALLKDALYAVSRLQKIATGSFHVPWLEYISN